MKNISKIQKHGIQLLLFALFCFQCMCSQGFASGVSILRIQSPYRDTVLCVKALTIAKSQIGVIETRNNRGEVEKYQLSTGNKPGEPYCYSGIYWCFSQSSKITNRKNILLRTGLASAGRKYLETFAINTRVLLVPGLIFWQYPKKSTGHVEMIFEFHRANWVRCVGFNTGSNNARDGGGVKITYRNYMHPLARMYVKSIIVMI